MSVCVCVLMGVYVLTFLGLGEEFKTWGNEEMNATKGGEKNEGWGEWDCEGSLK